MKPNQLNQNSPSFPAVRNVNREHKESLTKLERLAVWITDHVGTMGFFLIIFIWTLVWLSWNTFSPYKFDPAPAFVFWLFISNMIQIFLTPLIMIGQNLQSRHSQRRAEADYEVNRKSEVEVEAILTHLERQNELILQILDKLDNKKKKFHASVRQKKVKPRAKQSAKPFPSL